MKRLAVVAVLATTAYGQGIPGIGSVSPTLVKAFVSVSNGENNASNTNPTVTSPQNVGAGHLLVLCARDSTNNCAVGANPVTVSSIADSPCGDSWTQIGTPTPGPSTCMVAAWAKTSGCVANQVTIQWAEAGGNYGFFDSATVFEFSGQAPTNPLDGSATQTGTGAGATITSGSFSTAQANEIVVGCIGATNTNTTFSNPLIAGSAATSPAGGLNVHKYGTAMYSIESGILTGQTAAFTMNTSGGIIKIVAFK